VRSRTRTVARRTAVAYPATRPANPDRFKHRIDALCAQLHCDTAENQPRPLLTRPALATRSHCPRELEVLRAISIATGRVLGRFRGSEGRECTLRFEGVECSPSFGPREVRHMLQGSDPRLSRQGN